MKYICYKYGPHLLGANSKQVGEVEMMFTVMIDLKNATIARCYDVTEKKMVAFACLQHSEQIANFLGQKDFLLGDNITYVDFVLFEHCDFMNWITEGEIYARYPNLLAHYNKVKNLPKLKEFFLDDQKCIKSPFNSKHALINN